MTDQKTLKAVHIGMSTGHAGSLDSSRPRLIRTFQQLEGVEVVGYCETYDPSFLDQARAFNPAAGLYTSVDNLIENQEFDLACVVVLPRDVPDVLLKLANAGKHFLVDKQFARKSEDLYETVKSVRTNNITTFIAYPWRYHPAAQDLRDMVDRGLMGKPLSIEANQIFDVVDAVKALVPAHRNDTESGGSLHYVGCHIMDTMRFLVGGEVRSVQAITGRPNGHIEPGMEEAAMLALEYDNGSLGTLHCGYLGHLGTNYARISLRSELGEGHLEVGKQGGHPARLEVICKAPSWRGAPSRTVDYELPAFEGIMTSVWYHSRIERFISDIRAGEPGELNINDALYVLQSIDAAYESARTGRRVEVQYGV
jgi:predicted dehydrogenase